MKISTIYSVCFVLGWMWCAGAQADAGRIGAVADLTRTIKPADRQATALERGEIRNVVRGLEHSPLRFERNQGQADPEVRFAARGRGYQLFLTNSEAVLALFDDQASPLGAARPGADSPVPAVPAKPELLRMRLVGARTPSSVTGRDPLVTRVNYLRGKDPSRWQRDVPTFARAEFAGVYPGVDLVYYGNQGRLEYDFIVAPEADPSQLMLEFRGADTVSVNDAGDLVLRTPSGDVSLRAPVMYQDIAGRRRPVAGAWTLTGEGRAGFKLGPYDVAQAIVIDPVLEFSTYLGGSGSEDGFDNMGIALDSAGNIYIAGTSDSADFPTTGDIQDQFVALADAVVVKLDPSASSILYATYLGGDGLDAGQAIAVDGAGNAYVGGFTNSADFPTQAPLQATIGGNFDGFVAKIDPAGSALVYSTYIGGSERDFVLGIDVDDAGQVYMTGDVESQDFPLANALQPVWGGVWDSWAAKLTAAGDALIFSTYLGGSFADSGLDIKADADGFVYVTGFTISPDFPVANAFQDTEAGDVDAYVLKLEPDGSAFVYSTYLGGTNTDRAVGIDIDNFGNAYVVGDTFSVDFPSINAISAFGGFSDAYIAKFDPTGGVAYTTFLGGAVADHGLAIAADASGNVHITGMTFSHTFPQVSPVQDGIAGDVDAIVVTLDASGTRTVFSTFLGGSSGERGLGIAADAAGNIVVVGDTFSSDFPTVGPVQAQLFGERDIFVSKIVNGQDIIQDPSIQVEQLVAGLLGPRAMVFIGDGDLLVLENRGWVRRVQSGVLQPDPLLRLPVDLTVAGRPYGLALHPDFPATPLVYFYFTESDQATDPQPLGQRVYRYTWSGTALTNPELILDIPIGPASGEESGTLAFGPDGKLYVTSGDTGTESKLQNVVGGAAPDDTSVIMRLNDDGTVPTDNPFFAAGGNLAKYFAYGIRSSAAIAFDPVNGKLWAADNGQGNYDEINFVEPGFNGGWSQLVGPEARNANGSPNLVEFAGSAYRDPAVSWLHAILPTAMVFLDSGKVGDHYRNQLFVGAGINGELYRFRPDSTRDGLIFDMPQMDDLVADDATEASESLFGVGFGSISDLEVGPDGMLYILSSVLGRVYKVFWAADIDLRLSSPQVEVSPGNVLPVTLELENLTSKEQTFGIILSLQLPNGAEFPLVGPIPLTLPAAALGTVALNLPMPPGSEPGNWSFKGQIFRADQENPEVVDRSAVDFAVVGATP